MSQKIKPKIWTDNDDNYIIEHRETMTARDFAAHFGVSITAVEGRCKRRKIKLDFPHKRRMPRITKPNPKVEKAKALRESGLTYLQVENKTGVDRGNLCRAMKDPDAPKFNPSLIERIVMATMMPWMREKAA